MGAQQIDIRFKDYFAKMSIALFEPNSSAKISIRKALTEVGVLGKNIHIANKYHEMGPIIDQHCPNIVFSVDHDGTHNGLEFVGKHLTVRPNRLDAAFVVISNYNSLISVSEVAEYEVDFMVAKPFNQAQVMEKLLVAFKEKVDVPPYTKLIEEGKRLLFEEDFSGAREKLSLAIETDSKKSSGHYYLGVIDRKLENIPDAIKSFDQALSFEGDHFKSLIALFEIKFELKRFKEALGYARRILKNYPINPRRIDQFIRLAVATKSYADIVYYCELSKEIAFDESMEKFLSAGLAIGARQLIEEGDNLKLACLCLRHASRYCIKFPRICLSVVESLIKLGEIDRADSLLYKLINEEGHKTADAYILELDIIFRKKDYPKALLLALNLLKNKNFSFRVYDIAIKASIKIGRGPEFITEVYQDGVIRFPELKNIEDLVKSYAAGTLG
ncbi:MAG: hypothetical protein KAG61_04195 [Bacteriovoracaceae bacterium]|nr:hypothetical protein [Bacteriovoracaceae bacterium]